LREFSGLEVTVFHNDVEQAMRVLKKKLQNDGLFRKKPRGQTYTFDKMACNLWKWG